MGFTNSAGERVYYSHRSIPPTVEPPASTKDAALTVKGIFYYVKLNTFSIERVALK